MNTFQRFILALAICFGWQASVHAQVDLMPGSRAVGAGNLRGGQAYLPEPGSFFLDRGFYIGWGNSPVDPSQRFTDIVGQVSSLGWSSSLGLSPYLFTGVELRSGDDDSLLGRYAFDPGTHRIDFTFSSLLEGAYKLRFIGHQVPSPDGWWPVNEWQYSFSAVASPAPEPSELVLSVVGLAAVLWVQRRKLKVRRHAA